MESRYRRTPSPIGELTLLGKGPTLLRIAFETDAVGPGARAPRRPCRL